MPLRVFDNFPEQAIKPGLYQFDIVRDDARSRIHLRIDEDNSGLLIVNASRVVHLNQTAAQMAYYLLNQTDQQRAIRRMRSDFRVSEKKIKLDFETVKNQINSLINEKSSLCPVCDLGLEKTMPFSSKLTAPYRMDLALTYRCNNNCSHCYNARPRNYPELLTNTWKAIIDKIWELRIPHVVFTGGEPTLREDLVELVAYAQNKGMVTGLNTNGRRLADKSLLNALVEAGLDHVQITIESNLCAVHDHMVQADGAWLETLVGLRNVINSRLYMMTNTTLLKTNADKLESILNFLAVEHVPTVGLNALIYAGHGKTVATGIAEEDLPQMLELAKQLTSDHDQKLIWYTPTQYCNFNPMLLSLGVKGCTAAYYNMCIEPDGQVIPCQSYYEPLGHFLQNSWDSIWNHPLSKQLRERLDIHEDCKLCDFLMECGGGCPLARQNQKVRPVFLEVP